MLIADQIEDGRSGVLLPDPTDLAELGTTVRGMLDDPEQVRRLGRTPVSGPLSSDELRLPVGYSRGANYVSVGQIYLPGGGDARRSAPYGAAG